MVLMSMFSIRPESASFHKDGLVSYSNCACLHNDMMYSASSSSNSQRKPPGVPDKISEISLDTASLVKLMFIREESSVQSTE